MNSCLSTYRHKSSHPRLDQPPILNPVQFALKNSYLQASTAKEEMGGKSANKAGYFDKLKGLLEEYKSIFIVGVDNVSSQQMHEIRHALRGEAVVLMGKNTMVRDLRQPIVPRRHRRLTKSRPD